MRRFEDFRDYIRVAAHAGLAAKTAGAVFAIAALVWVVSPRTTTVGATLLPTSSNVGSATALAMMGVHAPAALKGERDPVRAFLDTRAIRAATAAKLGATDGADPLAALGYQLAVSEGSGGAIRLQVEGKGRSAADTAKVCALVLDSLKDLLADVSLSDARRQRALAEKLIDDNGVRRGELEEALMGAQDASVSLDPDVASLLSKISDLRAQASARKLEAEAIRSVAVDPPGDPVPGKSLLDQAADLQKQAVTLAAKAPASDGGSVVVPLTRVPLLALEYRRMEGELRVLDEINALLQQQRQMAMIEEAKDAPSFTVIDPPSESAATTAPALTQALLLALLSALAAGVGSAFLAAWWSSARPEVTAAWREARGVGPETGTGMGPGLPETRTEPAAEALLGK